MPQRPKTPWKLVEVPGGPNDQAAVKAKLEQLCCGDSRDPKTACEAIYAENMEQEVRLSARSERAGTKPFIAQVLPGAGLESAAVGDLYTAWNVYFDAEVRFSVLSLVLLEVLTGIPSPPGTATTTTGIYLSALDL